ncbi:hypothetical protein JJB71_12910 [Clostridium perfringens]|uniref:hypothetical protein n=1 Tax=Clostridium perfringens TaxID=1502 RepID=UPI001ABBA988|nr:hypothetical protein [Clostridium perfringens]MBO3398439.1 hypothetical protein [Clostridium perfringens]
MKIIDADNNEAIRYLHEQLDIVIESGYISLEDISMILDNLATSYSDKDKQRIKEEDEIYEDMKNNFGRFNEE